jgi:hypothetical protein
MNSSFIPTPQDETLRLEAVITKTATFVGTTVQRSGLAPGGIGMLEAIVVNVSAVDRTTGDETYVFQAQESADGATWTDAGPAAASVTAVGAFSVGAIFTQAYRRLHLTAAGTTPSITYEAYENPNVDVN